MYCEKLSTASGRKGIDARMVVGATIVKCRLGLDDRGTVAMIVENVYLQYFCCLPAFRAEELFHPTVFVDIRLWKKDGGREFRQVEREDHREGGRYQAQEKRNIDKGVNFTAGLSKVRTSPDHGTAYEIAGKGKADHSSFKEAVFTALSIFRNRQEYQELTENPLQRQRVRR